MWFIGTQICNIVYCNHYQIKGLTSKLYKIAGSTQVVMHIPASIAVHCCPQLFTKGLKKLNYQNKKRQIYWFHKEEKEEYSKDSGCEVQSQWHPHVGSFPKAQFWPKKTSILPQHKSHIHILNCLGHWACPVMVLMAKDPYLERHKLAQNHNCFRTCYATLLRVA